MKAIIPLPTIPLSAFRGSLHVHSPERAVAALPRIEKQLRKGAALHPSPMTNGADVLSLNLAQGCGHRCAFCSARAYPSHPGDGVLYLYSDNIDRIVEELAARKRKPRAVYVSPSTDPFPPLAEVQAETARIVETLANHGVASWLMTRGFIRPSIMRVLEAHRDLVKVTIEMTTMNRKMNRILEPLAAPPRMRIRQIVRLKELGIAVQVAVEPLIPGLTDTRANLEELLEALAAAGVRHISAGYMFLRQGIRDNMVRALQDHGWDEMVLAAFQGGPVLDNGSIAPAKYLSKIRRQRGYSTLMALAAGLGMTVSVNGLTNPDFRAPRPVAADIRPSQALLPIF